MKNDYELVIIHISGGFKQEFYDVINLKEGGKFETRYIEFNFLTDNGLGYARFLFKDIVGLVCGNLAHKEKENA